MSRRKRASDRQVAGAHYKSLGVEPWDVIDSWPIEQRIGYYRGNLLKYTMRMSVKGNPPAQEIAKAEHYAQKLQEVLKEKEDYSHAHAPTTQN